MEVILLKDVAKVGRKNEIITVSEGYAVNFLIPRGLAKAATAGAKKDVEIKKDKSAASAVAAQAQIAQGIASIAGASVTLRRKASESGSLFAAITVEHIAQAAHTELGVCLPESAFVADPIKHIGTFEIALHGGAKNAALALLVEREG